MHATLACSECLRALLEAQQHVQGLADDRCSRQVGECARVGEYAAERVFLVVCLVRRVGPPGEHHARPVGADLARILAGQSFVELIAEGACGEVEKAGIASIGQRGAAALAAVERVTGVPARPPVQSSAEIEELGKMQREDAIEARLRVFREGQR